MLNIKKNESLTYFNLQRYIRNSGAFPDIKIHKVNKSVIPQVKINYMFNSSERNQNIINKKTIFHKNNNFSFRLIIKNNIVDSFYKITCDGNLEGDLELKINEDNKIIKKNITEKELINIIKENKKLDFVKNYINSLHLKSNNEIII